MSPMLRRLAFFVLLLAVPALLAQEVPVTTPPTPDMSKVPWSPVKRNAKPGQGQKSTAAPPPASGHNSVQEGATTFSVNVRLVNVFTSVTDAAGAPYAGLEKQNFRVFEDGIEQNLSVFERESELPLSIVISVDASMSTHKDLPLEMASARKFVHAILRPVDSVAVYQFGTYVSQLSGFTNNERTVSAALGMLRPGAATALYDAIYLGAQALEKRPGRKVIVLISDGGDTSSKTDYKEALRAAQISEAMIFSIIMVPIEADAGRDVGGEHAMIQLSEDTGGKYFYASNTAQLDRAFAGIGDELRTQYLLAYYPIQRVGPEFRRIEIKLTDAALEKASKKLVLRHRSGYYNSKIE